MTEEPGERQTRSMAIIVRGSSASLEAVVETVKAHHDVKVVFVKRSRGRLVVKEVRE